MTWTGPIVVAASAMIMSPPGSAGASAPLPPQVARAVAIVRCYEPDPMTYGFQRGRCARVIRVDRAGAGVWRLVLRRPPLYCVALHLGRWLGDTALDVPRIGWLEEIRCPAAVYGGRPAAQLRIHFVGAAGVAAFTVVAAARTRVVIKADMGAAWIERGDCRKHAGLVARLTPFYSYRSETIVPVSLASLIRTPHVVLVDYGGAHGGDPLACATIRR